VIQSGVFEAFKTSKDGERVLFKYEGAGAFGELALMYNCPRAATVRVSPCIHLDTLGIAWLDVQIRNDHKHCATGSLPLLANP
jgi:hypothetical protein